MRTSFTVCATRATSEVAAPRKLVAGPEARKRAYQRQQKEMAQRRADTEARMVETYEGYRDAGDTAKAEWWADYLTDRGVSFTP